MSKISKNFGKVLLIITILIVLVFQGYWIWVNYQNKREEILNNTKFETTQILIQNMLNQPNIQEKLGDNKTKLSEANAQIEVYITQSESRNIINKKVKPQPKGKFYENDKLNSFLYSSLKNYFSKNLKKDVEIHIYIENKTTKKTYPAFHKITDKNTTKPINPLMGNNATFRIHIDNMNEIVIYEIREIIIFSVLYLLLCGITIAILFRNMNLSQKLLKNKEIFTQNMTHELKIPISTITIAAEGLEEYNIAKEPETVRKYAAIIQRATNQLSSLVDTILQHARAEHNNEKLTLDRINLLLLLQEIKTDLSGIILKKKAEINIEDVHSNIWIKGNFKQLKQVILNLIDNSLKYSEKTPEIIISAEKNTPTIIIRIKDNGIGIPAKYREDVFSPYFRIIQDDTHDVKGFGLGLSFVKKSLKNQGGDIKILHQTTEGTVMEIKIPAYE